MYIVSACLLGVNCKYCGGNNYEPELEKFLTESGESVCIVCPEIAGGLPYPRDPSEKVGNRVVSCKGVDVTKEYVQGAEKEFAKALAESENLGEKIHAAILKANSPSCGFGKIYDGTFSDKLVDGNGVFADICDLVGIAVFNEENYGELKEPESAPENNEVKND